MFFFKNKTPKIDPDNIPEHVAVIMDGNGRWAQKRGLPRELGHAAGEKALSRAIEAARKLNIKYLTVYAFSTENWRRPKKEIAALMGLLVKAVKNRTKELIESGIKVQVLGRLNELPENVQKAISDAVAKTKNGSKLTLNVMLNYGSRAEIIDAVKALASDVQAKKLKSADIKEESFDNYLYTKGIPDPDLLIRTSGEQRVSNYLLWQLAYTEFYFSKVLWPDFKVQHFNQAVLEYQRRHRRRGASS
jgi:undecaprenyl diphosphate synthase